MVSLRYTSTSYSIGLCSPIDFDVSSPSADNTLGYVERGRVENGGTIGPRIFQTGSVIYGAGARELHLDIADMDEAYSALIRIKAEGGEASFSYKNYNQPSRSVYHFYSLLAVC